MNDEPRDPATSRRPDRRRHFAKAMRWMAVFSLAVGGLAAALVAQGEEAVSIHLLLATAILAGGSVMMAGFLMSLIFYSNASGHDEAAARHEKDEQ
ncbi:hypothetical protein [Sphingomicrobium lutaoense]|uniref:Uncharacterized protein n=1 Tax=Sphingomicrobium lutaoense TaxID=515949 RepID=A0A839Z489_9SPHN|nr:hypothetical protein [Sphingomicrobium lutaoense]MBB3764907.1 hypothetical protein [Sphingomicrobium lutaoense]